MATKTSNYEFNKPEQNDFYDVDVQNENWDKVDEELSEFDDSGVTEDIKSFPDFLSKFVTGNKVAITLRNLKAGLQFVLHAGQIVNNCVTDNAGLPLSAAQGKVLKDLYTQLYSDLNTTNNNLSNSGIPIVKKITDLYSIKTSGFYYYDAGTTNAPQSSRGGMIIANYLSDSWISLIVVPYASSKIYTNTKYNNTWVGWAESATKNDFVIKTYTIAGKAVNAETIADFEPNIALSGYTPLGIVGTRLNAYGSVTLVYADLVDDTKARVRVRNNGTESVTGDNVIIRVLYFKS
ncbi:hypothetical protein KHY84_09605 [butyrate-producing bacterium]|jgi:hypothetical protein|nr:hypothetical protein [butyrate-producing bacterium]DAY94090.1 MAG TPA: putative tail fiber protein [Caudoviricetes sp.]